MAVFDEPGGITVRGYSGGRGTAPAVQSTPSFQHAPSPSQGDGFIHPQTDLVISGGARITRVYILQDKLKKRLLIDLVRDPVLVDQVDDVLAPSGAGRR